jgi:peptide/nickel transport system substrate-binding protein
MRRIAFRLLALISLACVARGATRPHYGGTLRAAIESAPTSLELPATTNPTDYWALSRILSLVGDTLVNVDAQDRSQPALAVSWQTDATARHWQFALRHGVKFHDGTPASPGAVAQILGALHPDWNLRSSADSLTIDLEAPDPSLLAELALPSNLILPHNSTGLPIGTGPFRVADFEPGKTIKLAAVEDCWSGRPFLDSIEIELNKSLREQSVSLELGRLDLIEAAPTWTYVRGVTATSLPVELLALVFPSNSKAPDPRLREALALSIDRKPIQSVLLKGTAEPTVALLPNWMTGYTAAFATQPNIPRARALLAESRQPALILSYDPRDPQSQLIAERIALNAREAGITVQVSLSGTPDVQLVRIALPSPDPSLALREAARALSLSPPILFGTTISAAATEDLYHAERALLEGDRVIPLFHLPIASVAATRVQGVAAGRLGRWSLASVWLEDSR